MSAVRSSGPLETLVRTVAGDPHDDEQAITFARGLALGALVGAAIAGSAIWQRRRGRTDGGATGRPGLPPGGAPTHRD